MDDRHKKAQKQISQKSPKTPWVIRGNLVLVRRSCGQSNCRCQRGYKHASWYVSQSMKGKTKMTYIPKISVQKVRDCIENYNEMKNILNELSQVNIKHLTRSAAGYGKKKKQSRP